MNEQEALNVLDNVAAKYSGTRQDHEILKAAIESIQLLINTVTLKLDKSEP